MYKRLQVNGTSEKYRTAIENHLLLGLGKQSAAMVAGLGPSAHKEVFKSRAWVEARNKYMSRIDEAMEDPEKAFLINFYRAIILAPSNEAPTAEIVEKYRHVRDPNDRANFMDEKIGHEVKRKVVTVADKIIAAKELSVLLGIREEKSKIADIPTIDPMDVTDNDLITKLAERRTQLIGAGDEEASEPV